MNDFVKNGTVLSRRTRRKLLRIYLKCKKSITLISFRSLLIRPFFDFVNRNQIANFLGFLLLVLALSFAVAGFFTWQKMNQIISSLETDGSTNNNLIQYKEILVNLHDMENHVESYDLTSDASYIERYNVSLDLVLERVDSINHLNTKDAELLIYNDSLESLINQKSDVLNELILLRTSELGDELNDLEHVIAGLSAVDTIYKPTVKAKRSAKNITAEPVAATSAETTSDQEKKPGIFKRIFGKNEKASEGTAAEVKTEPIKSTVDSGDSMIVVSQNELKAKLSKKLAELRKAKEAASTQLMDQELELISSHFDIQNQIMDLVAFLEGREAVKLKLKSVKARTLAATTSQQISIFFGLATLLLLSSVVVMIVYVKRNARYQQLLRESKNSAEILARAKERFFANMSHEIRTPMNAISGFTKVLLRSKLTEEQRDHVEIIDKSSEHLLHLLNDILDFSKLQAEKLQLEKISFDLAQVCNDSIRLLRKSAEEKGLKLTVELKQLPAFVLGDPYRLRQILLNLLNNGIKYTEKGEVKLVAEARVKEKDARIHIEVIDTGIGIPKEQQFRMFREFEQADQSSFSKGTGLGLAITKRLVTLHQGNIHLISKEGEGTTIKLDLHYPISESPEIQSKQVLNKDSLKGMKVLIADDEPFNVKLLATVLEKEGVICDKTYDGDEALKQALKNKYDMLLLDLKMPGKSGWEVASTVRATAGPNQAIPMIALTATVNKLDQQMGEEHGFNHLMRKPFDEQELFSIMLNAPGTEHHTTEEDMPEIELNSLMKMGDYAFVEDMVLTFISSSEDGFTKLSAAFSANDYDQVALLAHRIVAPARHFKATDLVSMLKNLEHRAEQSDETLSQSDLDKISIELKKVIKALNLALENLKTANQA